jgi:hypothetical protein
VPSASAPLGFILEPKRTVPSQRQIEANRRNARLSTGLSNQPGALDALTYREYKNERSNPIPEMGRSPASPDPAI